MSIRDWLFAAMHAKPLESTIDSWHTVSQWPFSDLFRDGLRPQYILLLHILHHSHALRRFALLRPLNPRTADDRWGSVMQCARRIGAFGVHAFSASRLSRLPPLLHANSSSCGTQRQHDLRRPFASGSDAEPKPPLQEKGSGLATWSLSRVFNAQLGQEGEGKSMLARMRQYAAMMWPGTGHTRGAVETCSAAGRQPDSYECLCRRPGKQTALKS